MQLIFGSARFTEAGLFGLNYLQRQSQLQLQSQVGLQQQSHLQLGSHLHSVFSSSDMASSFSC